VDEDVRAVFGHKVVAVIKSRRPVLGYAPISLQVQSNRRDIVGEWLESLVEKKAQVIVRRVEAVVKVVPSPVDEWLQRSLGFFVAVLDREAGAAAGDIRRLA
jgi:hypothetical protein